MNSIDLSDIEISEPIFIGDGLFIQYIKQPPKPLAYLHLIISEDTTIENIKNNWYKIVQLKEKLKEIQGKNFSLFKPSLIDYLFKLKNNGASYQDLAFDMNFDLLLFALAFCDNSLDQKYKDSAKSYFKNHLRAFAFKDKEINEYQKFAENEISKGNIPWNPAQDPISKEKIRTQLQLFKKSIDFVESKNWGIDYLISTRLWIVQKSVWSKATHLIETIYPKDYKKYFQRIDRTFTELIGYQPI